MNMLKSFFPFAFKVTEKDVKSLVISIIIHLVAGLVVSIVLGLVGNILPILGWLCGIVGSVVDLYCLVGIILAVLNFFNVLK